MMDKKLLFILLSFLSLNCFPQKKDTVKIDIPEIIFTATRTPNYLKDIPGRIEIIDEKIISDFPANTVDDILFMLPGLNVNRSWGIFSKNASVNLRGLSGTSRVLVLLNGLPLNKSAGGGINWNMIPPGQIQRIEICKGPGSAVYGNNAMTGVINIITKTPQKRFAGEIAIEKGSYGTIGTTVVLSGKNDKNTGLFWNMNISGKRGDGYILEPLENRDSTDTEAYMRDLSSGASFGYRFSKAILEINYNFLKDKRGTGTKIFEPKGSFLAHTSNYLSVKYKGKNRLFDYELKTFLQFQNYFEENESLNNFGDYKLYDRNQNSYDQGIWINLTREIFHKHRLTVGIDAKTASFKATDDYKTSSDFTSRKGRTDIAAIFIQDEFDLLNNKIKIITGLRTDFSRFYNGEFSVLDPTKNTGFPESENINYKSSGWKAFSPRFVLKYNINSSSSLYTSYSAGFKPASLDDLYSSRKIRKGFKLANPELKPEKLYNYEIGLNLVFWDKLDIQPSFYYSEGKDFQYFVGTGDSINTGGLSFKPVLKRENISDVKISGVELNINYRLNENLHLLSNYSYNYSEITKYDLTDFYGTDLTGKHLNEVPFHQFFSGIKWNNKIVNIFLTGRYVGFQYYDEQNTSQIDPYWRFDINISRKISDNFYAALCIQDIFDNRHIDKKGLLSPGRFVNVSLKYRI